MLADSVEIHGRVDRIVLARQRPDVIQNFHRAKVSLAMSLKTSRASLKSDGVRSKSIPPASSVRTNGGERLAQLVRNGGGHLAERRDASDVCELASALLDHAQRSNPSSALE